MTDGELADRAVRATALLGDPLYRESWELTRAAIISLIEQTPLSEHDTAEDLRRCLKLLRDVRANLELVMNQGKIASFRLEEEKRRKANPLRSFFR
ncbi:MAG: hypothetical protein ACREQ5_10625 [Candidatus Dormibacteria bacterium]